MNYDYENRYLFEVNAGYNGSNRFAEGHRYQLFPAASMGWVLTNEPFFKENPILSLPNYAFLMVKLVMTSWEVSLTIIVQDMIMD